MLSSQDLGMAGVVGGGTLSDYHICDPRYGMNLESSSCISARSTLPFGKTYLPYDVDSSGARYALPWSMAFDDCRISVEIAGPASCETYYAIPNAIRGLTDWLIGQCVTTGGGIGGFVTKDIGRMISFVTAPKTNIHGPYPSTSAFLTISVTSAPKVEPLPGDNDPTIATHLGHAELDAWNRAPTGSDLQLDLAARASYFQMQSKHMRTGGTTPWWKVWQGDEKMSYECDETLGAPTIVDCTKLQLHQIGPLNETFEVGPGKDKFLSSNTCNLAISADEPSIITWQQVRSALDTLMNSCVLHPGQGGRAYHSPQPVLSRRARNLGLNTIDAYALPLGANITIFTQHAEPVPADPVLESNTCTWQAVLNRRPVSSCGQVSTAKQRNSTTASA